MIQGEEYIMTLLSYQVFMAVVEQGKLSEGCAGAAADTVGNQSRSGRNGIRAGISVVYPQQAGRISYKLWKGTVSLHKKCTEQR